MNQPGKQMLGAAEEVRDFYERYPYPRPVDSLDDYRKRWQDPQRRRADYHLFWPARPYREEFSLLVAGCGTSQAAKHAMRWPEAKVTGIDFSATSVSCTDELKRKYDLVNLQILQLPLERASELGTSFDQIVCTGVLHHLPDPDAGLKALRDVLKPDGAMHLMVYAPYGRTGIYMLQDFCRRIGIQATDEGIRDLIAALRALPPGHPLENLLRQAPDFREEAALADALLHPQDRAYSVLQLLDFLQRGGFTFGRWLRQAPYSAHCGVLAQIPHAVRMAKLSLPEQYAAAELFRGTMVCHSAILYRDDNPAGPQSVGSRERIESQTVGTRLHADVSPRHAEPDPPNAKKSAPSVELEGRPPCRPPILSQPLSFAGDTWLGYVPIRMSDTICVQERLPPGAAAVLINQAHTCTDLFLPIDATEKRLLDAVDGTCDIGAIAERALSSSPTAAELDAVCTFFERLWWFDQVVFDTRNQR